MSTAISTIAQSRFPGSADEGATLDLWSVRVQQEWLPVLDAMLVCIAASVIGGAAAGNITVFRFVD